MDHGKLKALDSPLKLKASIPGKNVLEVSFAAAPEGWMRAAARAARGRERRRGQDLVFRIASNSGPATTMALMETAAREGVTVRSLSVQSTTLDDVFVHYAGRQLRDALQEAAPFDSSFIMRRGAR